MEITLYYKTYPCKINFAAMKAFKEATGEDLWSTLMNMWLCFDRASKERNTHLSLYTQLYKSCDVITASHLFHCMIKQENKLIQLEEIQDAMLNCGWLPLLDEQGNNIEDEQSYPWPLVMVKLATDVNAYFDQVKSEKK